MSVFSNTGWKVIVVAILLMQYATRVSADGTVDGLPIVMCVNAGGSAYLDGNSVQFAADDYFTGGNTASAGYDIESTTDDYLYQTDRWGNFSYSFPVPSSGDYSIQLYFAEVYYGATVAGGAGSRVFDISVEGQLKEDNYDISVEVPALTPIKKVYTTNVSDGQLNLDFGVVADFPKLSAACVYSGINALDSDSDGTPDSQDAFPNDPTETLDTDGDGVGDNGDAFPNDPTESSDIDSDGLGDNTDPDRDNDNVNNDLDAFPNDPTETTDTDSDGVGDNSDPNPLLPDSTLISCINAGGEEFTHSDGRVFGADQQYSGGNAGVTSHQIDGTEEDILFATERWRDFSYAIPAGATGKYTVELFFAEIYYNATIQSGGPGSRVFDILVEGGVVSDNFDILSEVASKTPLEKLYPVDITDGVADISFGVETDWPKLSGVCLYSGLKVSDTDGDGTPDSQDAFPTDPAESADTDNDGVGDNADAFPNDPAETVDSDGDGVGDNADVFPNDAAESADTDSDGVGDNADAFPNDPTEITDLDNDGIGDNADLDRDNDTVNNDLDAFPNDPSETTDTDNDGVGDNSDPNPLLPDSTLISCINAGGNEYIHSDGRIFSADQLFTGGSAGVTSHQIDGTENDELFASERWKDFSYSIPAGAAGKYTVELLFAEVYYQATTDLGGPGSRVFDILIEGNVVADNFDILAEVASKTALEKLYPLDVADGVVDIAFGVEADWPKLSAVCLYSGLKVPDADNDGVPDSTDAFPNDPAESVDSDNDGVGDNADVFPNDPAETKDLDSDGTGDNADLDVDGDGVNNDIDAMPFDATESADTDGDGWGDNSDIDPNYPNYELVSCVNAGGSAYSASGGIAYAADVNFSGGNTATEAFDISNTLDDVLYQSERWGDFSYSIPVTDVHTYTLELQFAEIFHGTSSASGGPGSRVFDVVVEGQTVRSAFDILQNNAAQEAVVEQVVLDITDGDIDVSFNMAIDWPKLSAYCVYKGLKLPDQDNDGTPDSFDAFPNDPTEQQDSDSDGVGDNADAFPNDPTESADLDNDGTGDNTDTDRDGDGVDNDVDLFPYDPTESADTDGDGFGDNSDPQPTVPNFDLVSCVNVGGAEYTASNGAVYLADQFFAGGTAGTTTLDITGTVDGAIYQSERWGEFSYAIPVAGNDNKPYTVELKFAETYYQATVGTGGVGSRIFDVSLEGQLVANNLDIYSKVGSSAAYNKTYFTNTSDGAIDIVLQKEQDWATLSGVCVYLGIKPIDTDDDGVSDNLDAFPEDPNESADSDLDGVGDNADLFPNDPSETTDLDGDGIGDNSDDDRDGDSYLNDGDAFPNDPTEWVDTDGDSIGDNSDPDPLVAAPIVLTCINVGGPEFVSGSGRVYIGDQYGIGGTTSTNTLNITDSADPAIHTSQRWGDFVYNIPVQNNGIYTIDLYFAEPYWGVETAGGAGSRLFNVRLEDRLILANYDQSALSIGGEAHETYVVSVVDGLINLEFDGIRDNPNLSAVCVSVGSGGTDTDGDGLPDDYDQMPFDASELNDSDYDGIGDNADPFPNNAEETQDSDGDGVGDNGDVFPLDPAETSDLDNDGIGDNADTDRDGDGVPNGADAFPDDSRVHTDTDSDGTGDARDAEPNNPLVSLYSEQFSVKFVQSGAQVNSLVAAEQVIADAANLVSQDVQSDVINYKDGGSLEGKYPGSVEFPLLSPVVIEITRQFYVSESDTYSFLLRSDGGISLTVNGQTIIQKTVAQTQDDLYGIISLTPGLHDLRVVYYETAADSTIELMAARGDATALYSHPNHFELLTDRVEVELQPWPTLPAHIGGAWGNPIQWPEIPASAIQMPDGKLLTMSGGEDDWYIGDGTIASVYDPATGTFVSRNHLDHNMFCSGISQLENGNLFMTGGNNIVAQSSEFDINSLEWITRPEMFFPRWYPTQMTMPDNRVFTTFANGSGNTSEVYSPVTDEWVHTTGANMQGMLNDHSIINTYPLGNGSTDMQWYGFMHVAPNGKVFQSGPTQTMHWFTADGLGTTEVLGPRLGGDQARMFGSAVMYDIGKILVTGGNDHTLVIPSSDTSITVELNGAVPVVKEGKSMHYRRTFQNSVVLPDGKVMVIGGSTDGILFSDDGTVMQPEMWDPATGDWSLMSSHSIPRNYHSTAILMKDATVFSGGGGACNGCDADHSDAQFYTPAYLFNMDGSLAQRPVISSGPALAQAGDVLTFAASAGVSKFNMIRLQGTTHSINTDQRFVPVAFEEVAGDYQLTINSNTNVMIPGYYWVFALDANGVPSVGHTLQIVRDPSGIDTDGDGIPDNEDLFPLDPAEGTDQDGDGVGDNGDAFPTDPNETQDSDLDGVGDNADVFPNDSAETVDSDGDGFGDNRDVYPNDSTRFTNAATVVRHSMPIIVVEGGVEDSVWNVNPDNNTVARSNAGLTTVAEIAVGNHPATLVMSPASSEVFVTNKADATISVIDMTSNTVTRMIALPTASKPHGIVVSSNGLVLYVALEAVGQVVRIEATTGVVTHSVSLGGNLRHLALTDDDSTVYVTNFVTPMLNGESTANIDVASGGGELYALNAATLAMDNKIELGYSNRGVTDVAGPGLPNYLNAPVLTPNGQTAYVPSKQDNILAGGLRGGTGMNFDQTVRAVTSIVNLQANTENPGARIHHDNSSLASGAVFSGNGRYLFVALETSREVAAYDIQSGFELTRIDVGMAPQGVATSTDGTRLYVYNFMDRSVQQFDLSQLLYAASTSVPLLSSASVVSSELLSAEVKLGKQLFYDAADDRLALDNYMSCASCHNEGGADGRVWDLTGMGEGLRNTISLVGKGQNNGILHWSGNFDEVQDFENQIRSLAGGTGLMTDVDFAAAESTLGTPKAGLSTDLDAMAAYLASLSTIEASPERNGALSTLATEGQALFTAEGCSTCHAGTSLTDSALGARHDVGTITAASGSRLAGTLDGFDTPSLYMLWATAPYLHDASASTVSDAINAHTTFTLDASKVTALEQFLKELQPGDL
ncbi:hypothetical protein A9Q99_20175 [Gammaproteobacteria bacterium 45_16_T64]|nr:hypothetical protein A9Q99_20175 [Gammaproteobacteria bacterium 45_16_T64]